MNGEEWPEDWPALVERAKLTLGELGEVRGAVKAVALLIRDVRTETRAELGEAIREKSERIRWLQEALEEATSYKPDD